MARTDYIEHLIWAVDRVVESRFRRVRTTGGHYCTAWYLLSGGVRVEHADEATDAAPGQWLIRRAAEGTQHFEDATRLISIRFELRHRGGLPAFERREDYVVPGRRCPKLKPAADRLVRRCAPHLTGQQRYIVRDALTYEQALAIDAAFMDFLAHFVKLMGRLGEQPRQPRDFDPRVERAVAMIEDHPPAEKFSESQLARRCGLSINQLNRLFQQALTRSPYAYYDELRSRQVRRLLTESNQQIKQIAYAQGFSSPAHFATWFRQRHTITPRQFRRQHASAGI